MNASSIIMAIEAMGDAEKNRSSYKQGQIMSRMWGLFLSPDTEMDTLYGKFQQMYTDFDNQDWGHRNQFLYYAKQPTVLGYLLYYSELNCPEQVQKLLDLEVSRLILDKAVTQVQAIDKMMHTDVTSKIKAAIVAKVQDYSTLKMISIGGGKTNDTKLRLSSFYMDSTAYSFDKFIESTKTYPSIQWDVVVNHVRNGTTVMLIPEKLGKKIWSAKSAENIEKLHAKLDSNYHRGKRSDRSVKVFFTDTVTVRGNNVHLDFTDFEVKIGDSYGSSDNELSMTVGNDLEAYLQAQGFKKQVVIRGNRLIRNTAKWGGLDYTVIEKEIRQVLEAKRGGDNGKV
jgi:hypothetical protein